MRLTGLTTRLATPDLARTVGFYRDVLGFAVARAEDSFAFVGAGAVELMFVHDPDAKVPAARGLVFAMEGVEELHARVTRAGVRVLWGPEVYDYGFREFSIADPDGNELIFSEPVRQE